MDNEKLIIKEIHNFSLSPNITPSNNNAIKWIYEENELIGVQKAWPIDHKLIKRFTPKLD